MTKALKWQDRRDKITQRRFMRKFQEDERRRRKWMPKFLPLPWNLCTKEEIDLLHKQMIENIGIPAVMMSTATHVGSSQSGVFTKLFYESIDKKHSKFVPPPILWDVKIERMSPITVVEQILHTCYKKARADN